MSAQKKDDQEANRPNMAKELENYSRSKYTSNDFTHFMKCVEHAAYGGNSPLANELTKSLFTEWKDRGKFVTGNFVEYASHSVDCRSPVKSALFSALAALDKGKPRKPSPKDLQYVSQRIYNICLLVGELAKNDNKAGKLDEDFLRNDATPKHVAEILTKIAMIVYDELSSKLRSHVNANGFAINYIALACLNVRDDSNTEKFCKEGINLLKDMTEFELLARLYQTKGNLLKAKGDRNMAEACLKKAENYALKMKNEQRRSALQNYITKDLQNMQAAVCDDDTGVHHPYGDLHYSFQ